MRSCKMIRVQTNMGITYSFKLYEVACRFRNIKESFLNLTRLKNLFKNMRSYSKCSRFEKDWTSVEKAWVWTTFIKINPNLKVQRIFKVNLFFQKEKKDMAKSLIVNSKNRKRNKWLQNLISIKCKIKRR